MRPELQWINHVRLPEREGLWQIEIQQGKIVHIMPQPPTRASGEALDAEGGLAFLRLLNRIFIWTPRRQRVSLPGISLVRCSKALSAGLSVRPR